MVRCSPHNCARGRQWRLISLSHPISSGVIIPTGLATLWQRKYHIVVVIKLKLNMKWVIWSFHGAPFDTFLDYSLQLVRKTNTDTTASDDLSAQWISDLLTVPPNSSSLSSSVCLGLRLTFSSVVQVKLFEETVNGTGSLEVIFTTGSNLSSTETIQGRFQISLMENTRRTQVVVVVNENTTIDDVSVELNTCRPTGDWRSFNDGLRSCAQTHFYTAASSASVLAVHFKSHDVFQCMP